RSAAPARRPDHSPSPARKGSTPAAAHHAAETPTDCPGQTALRVQQPLPTPESQTRNRRERPYLALLFKSRIKNHKSKMLSPFRLIPRHRTPRLSAVGIQRNCQPVLPVPEAHSHGCRIRDRRVVPRPREDLLIVEPHL